MNSNLGKQSMAIWSPDLGNGYYQNPIIHADYSDPDVIRVGEDFFMVASSFNMSPCLPVLHSKDLVNWTIINHVFEKLPFSYYDEPRQSEGVWAPSIRYHKGQFWVFFATPDDGIFMSKTNNPFGTWSSLHLVKKTKGWIDPCPFWDEDGQAYLVHAFAKSRIGFKSVLHICKMKPDGTELLDEGTLVFDGNAHHPTIEGPKLYKRNGFYYIVAPAGGVTDGWQTILRSKNVYGPYEDKIVLAQGSTAINGPHQGAWVELKSGESWFIHFQDKGAYGRITHLQPMSWEDDWPLIGSNINANGVGEPVMSWKKPLDVLTTPTVPQTSDDFSGDRLGLQWQWRANVKREWYSLLDNKLRLFSRNRTEGVTTLFNTGQIVTQKFPAFVFTATTSVSFHPHDEDDVTGLIVFGHDYAGLKIRRGCAAISISFFNGYYNGEKAEEDETLIKQIEAEALYLRVEVKEHAICQFSYSVDQIGFQEIGSPFQANSGGWSGAQLGIFCLNEGVRTSSGYADFDWFYISENEKGDVDGNI
ncbi:glycoside hydrolase family 43 protein [Halalkalibacter alkalisediminis]|uniref:Glycoside hydrolase 43 family protein n=1 Tax=Halalkalibacter alkalisediminis TaxID=935616 RepID=A0ABV6NCB9_9BACI|nr:glycoside hydrolase 43 family protein [Halalkalibacter alkalisediminis]